MFVPIAGPDLIDELISLFPTELSLHSGHRPQSGMAATAKLRQLVQGFHTSKEGMCHLEIRIQLPNLHSPYAGEKGRVRFFVEVVLNVGCPQSIVNLLDNLLVARVVLGNSIQLLRHQTTYYSYNSPLLDVPVLIEISFVRDF